MPCVIVTQIYATGTICRWVYPSADIWIRLLYGCPAWIMAQKTVTPGPVYWLMQPPDHICRPSLHFIGFKERENSLVKVTILWSRQLEHSPVPDLSFFFFFFPLNIDFGYEHVWQTVRLLLKDKIQISVLRDQCCRRLAQVVRGNLTNGRSLLWSFMTPTVHTDEESHWTATAGEAPVS